VRGVNNGCARGIGAFGNFVDDQGLECSAPQFSRERQTGRTCSDDQNVGLGGKVPLSNDQYCSPVRERLANVGANYGNIAGSGAFI
jgi:hypothetical protein